MGGKEKAMKALMTLDGRSNNNWCPPAITAAPAPLDSVRRSAADRITDLSRT